MNTLIIRSLIIIWSVLALAKFSPGVLGQGVLWVDNWIGDIVNAPVYDTDCRTRLSGNSYLAQAYIGPTPEGLQAAGPTFTFRTGQAAGFINSQEPAQSTEVPVPFLAVGPVYAQLRAWEAAAGATYEQAAATGGKYGFSNLVHVEPGFPPGPAEPLIGLQSFCLIPEPSPVVLLTGAMVLLGGFTLIRARKT